MEGSPNGDISLKRAEENLNVTREDFLDAATHITGLKKVGDKAKFFELTYFH